MQKRITSAVKKAKFNHFLVVAKVRARLAADKERSHRFHMKRFNLRS
jgi:hypothetical protein